MDVPRVSYQEGDDEYSSFDVDLRMTVGNVWSNQSFPSFRGRLQPQEKNDMTSYTKHHYIADTLLLTTAVLP